MTEDSNDQLASAPSWKLWQKKYHWNDLQSTTPYPFLPYRQKFDKPIMLSIGACFGIQTGVRTRGETVVSYYIRGLFIRRPLKVRGTYSVYAYFVSTLDLDNNDIEWFDIQFRKTEYYKEYKEIRDVSMRV